MKYPRQSMNLHKSIMEAPQEMPKKPNPNQVPRWVVEICFNFNDCFYDNYCKSLHMQVQ